MMLAAPPLKTPVLVASAAIQATGIGIIFWSNFRWHVDFDLPRSTYK